MTMEECRAIEMASIPYLTERLHKFGMNFLFSLDSKGRNIVHKLMNINRGTLIVQTDVVNFIEQVLDIFPALVCQVDINGDTPLHILVRNPFNTMIRIPVPSTQQNNYNLSSLSTLELLPKLLELCRTYFQIAEAGVNVKGSHYDPPWLMQNVEGNTPLHEAFMADSDTNMVRTLLTLDIDITSKLLNKREQTPLHLLAGRSQGKSPSLLNFNRQFSFWILYQVSLYCQMHELKDFGLVLDDLIKLIIYMFFTFCQHNTSSI